MGTAPVTATGQPMAMFAMPQARKKGAANRTLFADQTGREGLSSQLLVSYGDQLFKSLRVIDRQVRQYLAVHLNPRLF